MILPWAEPLIVTAADRGFSGGTSQIVPSLPPPNHRAFYQIFSCWYPTYVNFRVCNSAIFSDDTFGNN
jgi:hypothetical protein